MKTALLHGSRAPSATSETSQQGLKAFLPNRAATAPQKELCKDRTAKVPSKSARTYPMGGTLGTKERGPGAIIGDASYPEWALHCAACIRTATEAPALPAHLLRCVNTAAMPGLWAQLGQGRDPTHAPVPREAAEMGAAGGLLTAVLPSSLPASSPVPRLHFGTGWVPCMRHGHVDSATDAPTQGRAKAGPPWGAGAEQPLIR